MWSDFLRNFWTLKVPFSYTSPNAWLFIPRVSILLLIYIPNLILLVVVCASPSLRYPRNLFWCAVCCSDLILAAFFTTEITLSMSGNTSEFWCILVVMLYSTPYCLLLNNVAIASWDREMAIQHPIWHRRKMTNKRVMVIILASNSVAFILAMAPYWTKLVPATCEFYCFHVELTCCSYFFMISVCVVLHIKVLMAARKAIRSPHVRLRGGRPLKLSYAPPTNLQTKKKRGSSSDDRPPFLPNDIMRKPTLVSVGGETLRSQDSTNHYLADDESETSSWGCVPVYSPVSRLEIKAAVTITLGLVPLWVFSLPMVLTSFLLAICLQWGESDCSHIHFGYLFVREIYLLHGIYNPLVYMYRSREFQFAFKRLLRRTWDIFFRNI